MRVSRTGKLNKRLKFLKPNGTKPGPNGQKIPNFEDSKPVWFGYKQKYRNQLRDEIGTAFEDTLTIVIRQRQREEPKLDWKVVIKEQEYDIVKINPDVENEEFMLLFIKAVK